MVGAAAATGYIGYILLSLAMHPYSFYQQQGYSIIGVMPDANGRGKPDIIMGKRVDKKGKPQL